VGVELVVEVGVGLKRRKRVGVGSSGRSGRRERKESEGKCKRT
jgi:hypothetical protein